MDQTLTSNGGLTLCDSYAILGILSMILVWPLRWHHFYSGLKVRVFRGLGVPRHRVSERQGVLA